MEQTVSIQGRLSTHETRITVLEVADVDRKQSLKDIDRKLDRLIWSTCAGAVAVLLEILLQATGVMHLR